MNGQTKHTFDRIAGVLEQSIAKAKKSEFYQDRIKMPGGFSEANFKRIPATNKEDLRQNYPFGLLATERKNIATFHESSGSTGEPTSSYFTDSDWVDVASRFLRNGANIGSDDTVFIKTPYSLVTTAHQMQYAARSVGAMVIPAGNRSAMMSYPKVIRLLKQISPTVTWSLATELMIWRRVAQETGLDLATDFPELRAMLVAGEPLSDRKRIRIGELWGGKQVFQDYGSTETGSLGGSCSYGKTHIWTDRLYFEIYDDKSKTFSESGRGSLLITTLFREAMPLIRYELGDDVEISSKPCVCGSEFPTIEVFGRAVAKDVAKPPHSFLEIEGAVFTLPIHLGVVFWQARWENTRLDVEIECSSAVAREAKASLESILGDLGMSSSVKTLEPESLVKTSALMTDSGFAKPRYIIEDPAYWNRGLQYANSR